MKMNFVGRQLQSVHSASMLALAAMWCSSLAAPSATAQVSESTALTDHTVYEKLSAGWWQWALAIPVHEPPFSSNVHHPLVDLTGIKCGVHQSGPVWYLGGAFFELGTSGQSQIVRNDCSIPSSKALFFPILNTECTSIEGPGNGCGATVAESRSIVNTAIDGAANLEADVDGVAVAASGIVRVDSPTKRPYCIFLAPDDLLSFIGEGPGGYGSGTHFSPGLSCGTVDDGYYVLLSPLSRGAHAVHFHGEFPASTYILDVTYNLTVQ